VDGTFRPYGPVHWTVLIVVVTGALLLALLGRRTRGSVVFARTFAVVIVAYALAMQVYRLLPGHWDIATSLPLHFSDLTWMTAAYALWTRRQWAFALTYYWGLTLNPQAMLTPALDAPDFPHIEFIDFWVLHTLAVWATVLLTWGLGMRPNWRSFTTAVTVTVAWGVVLLGFNSLAGTNYGFVNAKPENPSLLDLMGDWPWYLGAELVIGIAAWALITWPWTRRRSLTDARSTGSRPVGT
jgi:hypothetical integral membrane protein (TIGR02206 family)